MELHSRPLNSTVPLGLKKPSCRQRGFDLFPLYHFVACLFLIFSFCAVGCVETRSEFILHKDGKGVLVGEFLTSESSVLTLLKGGTLEKEGKPLRYEEGMRDGKYYIRAYDDSFDDFYLEEVRGGGFLKAPIYSVTLFLPEPEPEPDPGPSSGESEGEVVFTGIQIPFEFVMEVPGKIADAYPFVYGNTTVLPTVKGKRAKWTFSLDPNSKFEDNFTVKFKGGLSKDLKITKAPKP